MKYVYRVQGMQLCIFLSQSCKIACVKYVHITQGDDSQFFCPEKKCATSVTRMACGPTLLRNILEEEMVFVICLSACD